MSNTRSAAEVDVIGQTSERSLVVPVILLILAILYDLSPIDIIPDIPVIGYIDDLFVTATATLNLLQKWLRDSSTILSSMLGMIKWIVIFAGIIAVLLFGMAGWGIVKAFTG